MRAPSQKRLLEAFPHLSPDAAKLIRALAKATDDVTWDRYGHVEGTDPLEKLVNKYPDPLLPHTERHVRSLYTNPYRSHMWRVTVALEGMNEIMGTYGVEGLGPDVHGPTPPPYEYLNTGDTYGTTLIYRRRDNSLNIGSWGDIAERHSNW